jgi:hypothetical protein
MAGAAGVEKEQWIIDNGQLTVSDAPREAVGGWESDRCAELLQFNHPVRYAPRPPRPRRAASYALRAVMIFFTRGEIIQTIDFMKTIESEMESGSGIEDSGGAGYAGVENRVHELKHRGNLRRYAPTAEAPWLLTLAKVGNWGKPQRPQ